MLRNPVRISFVPFQVAAEHVAAAIAGMQHLRNFAGFAVTMPHKTAVAQLCDTLLPNAQDCGVVNTVQIDPDGRLIGETFDGVGMVQALTAHRILDAGTRVLLVGARGVGQAMAPELGRKRLDLLKEALPNVSHAAVLWSTGNLTHQSSVENSRPRLASWRASSPESPESLRVGQHLCDDDQGGG